VRFRCDFERPHVRCRYWYRSGDVSVSLTAARKLITLFTLRGGRICLTKRAGGLFRVGRLYIAVLPNPSMPVQTARQPT
jgi:hypothetical protein